MLGKLKNIKIPAVIAKLVVSIWKISPKILVSIIISNLIIGLIPVLQINITKNLIIAVEQIIRDGSKLNNAYYILGGQFFLFCSLFISQSINRILNIRLQQKVKYYFDTLIIQKAVSIPINFYDDTEFLNHLQRISIGADVRGTNLISTLLGILQNMITVISISIYLFSIHWLLSISLFALIVPTLIVTLKMGRYRYLQVREQTPNERKVSYFTNLFKDRSVAKEIRLFGHAQYIKQQFDEIYWKNTNERYKLEKNNIKLNFLADASTNFIVALFIGSLIWIVSKARLTLPMYVAITESIVRIQSTLVNLANNFGSIKENALFIKDFYEFTESGGEEEQSNIRFPKQLSVGIELKDVSFMYNSSKYKIIKNINLTIRPKEKIVIVGENGAGKSTLVKCILGLYRNYAGKILIDGLDIKGINKSEFNQNITAIFQDFVKYELTLKENITLGSEVGNLEVAATSCGIDNDFLSTLPQKYNTLLGPLFLGGIELSGGMWQKVALARAMYRNSQVIILDEPSASLDPLSEIDFFDKIMNVFSDKTTIFISHRLGICKKADRIIVMSKGEIVEEGSHYQLIENNGHYSKMFEKQIEWYK